MRKLHIIAIIIVLASIAAAYLHKHKSSTLNKRDTNFNITEIEKINRINITSHQHDLNLLNDNSIWKVNKEIVNQKHMTDLLILAAKLQVISPAAKSDENVLSEKLNEAVKVSYYSGRKIINSYSICSWNMKIFAIRTKSKKIFQIEARGYPNVDLTKVFNAEASHWLSIKTINFSPEEIALVKIQYPGHSSKDFEIRQSSPGNYHLSDQSNTDMTKSANLEMIDDYLHFFRDISYIPVNDQEHAEIIDQKEAFFIMHIETNIQSGIVLYGYRKLNPENEELNIIEFYGRYNEKDLVILKYTDFDPILMDLKDFLKK